MVNIKQEPLSPESLSPVNQPQVCVYTLSLNRLETQLYGQCHVTYFAEQCRDASIRQSTASGMFVCVHHNLLLNWNNQIARWCALQGPAAVGGFQPQVSALTQSVIYGNTQL